MPEVQKIITNAVKWACPIANIPPVKYDNLPLVIEIKTEDSVINGSRKSLEEQITDIDSKIPELQEKKKELLDAKEQKDIR